MKLYIVGAVGSGKSTLARRISQRTGVPCTHLDEVVYEKDPTTPMGDRKRPEEEIAALFEAALNQPHFILEDTGRERFLAGMARADTIVLMDPPTRVRRYRIVKRWLKQRLGLEKSLYRPSFKVLRAMFGYTQDYDTGRDGTKARVARFAKKARVLVTRRDVEQFLQSLPEISNF